MRGKRSAVPLVLTAPEVAAVVTRLEHADCTVRRVRYLLSGLLASDAAPHPGHVRRYGPVDVALMRLSVRLGTQGVSPWVARVVLAYSRDVLAAAWLSGGDVSLVVRGVTGTIETATPDRNATGDVVRVRLRSVWAGIESAIRDERRARPQIWRWKVPPAAALGHRRA